MAGRAGVYPVFAPDLRRNSGRQQSQLKETRTEANKSTSIQRQMHAVFRTFSQQKKKDAPSRTACPASRKLRRKFSYCHFIFRGKLLPGRLSLEDVRCLAKFALIELIVS